MAEQLATATLGRTGLEVTRLGFGAMEIRGGTRGRPTSDAEAEAILTAVLDAGITYIDTSNDYGRSEELIGRFIAGRRDEYFLATKCGCVGPAGGQHVWTRENMMRGLEQSLELLRTDYVDVMQLHGASVEESEREGVVDTLNDMREQGKVRHIATSTSVPNLPTFIEWGSFDLFQIPYSALNREHEAWISTSAEAGIGTVIRGGVQKGEPGEGGGQADAWDKFEQANLDELRAEGESRTAFMLRYTLSHPDVHTIIVGTKNPAHLRENLETERRGPLAPDVYAEAKRRLDAIGEAPASAG
ncbi:MAG: aldo/keto reductase [Chloroflexi bacterium]|nr:aldo/keto reductase [Chloroflexota bacterium]